jgi:hypothetical protein
MSEKAVSASGSKWVRVNSGGNVVELKTSGKYGLVLNEVNAATGMGWNVLWILFFLAT